VAEELVLIPSQVHYFKVEINHLMLNQVFLM